MAFDKNAYDALQNENGEGFSTNEHRDAAEPTSLEALKTRLSRLNDRIDRQRDEVSRCEYATLGTDEEKAESLKEAKAVKRALMDERWEVRAAIKKITG